MAVKLVVGGIGGGKTCSAVKFMKYTNQKVYTNIDLKNMQPHEYYRLKVKDLLTKDEDDKVTGVNWDFWQDSMNRDGSFHICIDEFHKIAHARESMTKKNIKLSEWVSEVRKILGESESNHLVIMSQKINKIDRDFRDLASEVITCAKKITQYKIPTQVWVNECVYCGAIKSSKTKLVHKESCPIKRDFDRKIEPKLKTYMKVLNLPLVHIFNICFLGEDCVEQYLNYMITGERKKAIIQRFDGNPMFKYYNSYGLVRFGESEYL